MCQGKRNIGAFKLLRRPRSSHTMIRNRARCRISPVRPTALTPSGPFGCHGKLSIADGMRAGSSPSGPSRAFMTASSRRPVFAVPKVSAAMNSCSAADVTDRARGESRVMPTAERRPPSSTHIERQLQEERVQMQQNTGSRDDFCAPSAGGQAVRRPAQSRAAR